MFDNKINLEQFFLTNQSRNIYTKKIKYVLGKKWHNISEIKFLSIFL